MRWLCRNVRTSNCSPPTDRRKCARFRDGTTKTTERPGTRLTEVSTEQVFVRLTRARLKNLRASRTSVVIRALVVRKLYRRPTTMCGGGRVTFITTCPSAVYVYNFGRSLSTSVTFSFFNLFSARAYVGPENDPCVQLFTDARWSPLWRWLIVYRDDFYVFRHFCLSTSSSSPFFQLFEVGQSLLYIYIQIINYYYLFDRVPKRGPEIVRHSRTVIYGYEYNVRPSTKSFAAGGSNVSRK